MLTYERLVLSVLASFTDVLQTLIAVTLLNFELSISKFVMRRFIWHKNNPNNFPFV